MDKGTFVRIIANYRDGALLKSSGIRSFAEMIYRDRGSKTLLKLATLKNHISLVHNN